MSKKSSKKPSIEKRDTPKKDVRVSNKSAPQPYSRKPKFPVQHFAFTIPEFCEAHRVSISGYYKMRLLGRGPKETRPLPKLPIITYEDAAEWRRTRSEEVV